MGIRLHAYAVDLPRLNALLDSSLAELLVQHAIDSDKSNKQYLSFTFTNKNYKQSFIAQGNGSFYRTEIDNSGKSDPIVTERQLRNSPILQGSVRDYQTSQSPYDLKYLFDVFSHRKDIDIICKLIDGQHRAWIGSILQYAKGQIPTKDYDDLKELFRQILCGYSCGYPVLYKRAVLPCNEYPFKFENHPDMPIGFWTDIDVLYAEEILKYIMSQSPTFVRPPGPIGIAPNDESWNQWVCDNITSLLRVDTIEYDICNVFSFIG